MEHITGLIKALVDVFLSLFGIISKNKRLQDEYFSYQQLCDDYFSRSRPDKISKHLFNESRIEIVNSIVRSKISKKQCRSERLEAILIILLSLLVLELLKSKLEGNSEDLIVWLFMQLIIIVICYLMIIASVPVLFYGNYSYIQKATKLPLKIRLKMCGKSPIRRNSLLYQGMLATELYTHLKRNKQPWTIICTANPNINHYFSDFSTLSPDMWRMIIEEKKELFEKLEVFIFADTNKEAEELCAIFRSCEINAFSLGGDSRDTFIRTSFFRRLKYAETCGLEGLDEFPPYVDLNNSVVDFHSTAKSTAKIIYSSRRRIVIDYGFGFWRLVTKRHLEGLNVGYLKNLKNCHIENQFLAIRMTDEEERILLDDIYRVSDSI